MAYAAAGRSLLVSHSHAAMSAADAAAPRKTRVGFNGLGRIGRLVFRILWDDPAFDIVHVNDVCACESSAYLLQFDTVHRRWAHDVAAAADGGSFTVGGDAARAVTFSQCEDFTQAPWADRQVDMVLECSGKFNKKAVLEKYLAQCGVKRVVVSAPVKEEGVLNIVLGCNEGLLREDVPIVTNASCTTNCLAPVVKVIHETFEIKHGCITTIHNVTGTQTLVDMPNTKKSDLRRARSGMNNLAPTSTGSATAIAEIFPELRGRLNGLAVRVPLTNASITDCVFEVTRATTAEEVNAALEAASKGPLASILGFETRPLVSTDYVDDDRSSIVDAPSTQVIDGTMVKIYAWYDNEWGYSKRMAELALLVNQKFLSQQ